MKKIPFKQRSDQPSAGQPSAGQPFSDQPSSGDTLDFVALRTVELEPWLPYVYGNRFASIVAVKGEAGEAEREGKPFFGEDAEALENAFVSLGWGFNSWCGVTLEVSDKDTLSALELRMIVEIIDPQVVVALDRRALLMLQEGYGDELLPEIPSPGKKTTLLGRTFVYVDGFEVALASDDEGEAKRRVWRELKVLKR